MLFCNSQEVGIIPNSKKIKKYQPQKRDEYNVFSKEQKQHIINEILRELDPQLLEKEFSPGEILSALSHFDVSLFNKVLIKCLKRYPGQNVPSMNDAKYFKQFRQRVKSWITNMEKPDTRGGRLVPHETLPKFKEILIERISSLKSRNFRQVQAFVEKILKEINIEKACSKHFWYNFLSRNPDIEELWEKIPGGRGKKRERSELEASKENMKLRPNLLVNDFSSADAPNLTSVSPTSQKSNNESYEEKFKKILEISVPQEMMVVEPSKLDFYKQTDVFIGLENNETQRAIFAKLIKNGGRLDELSPKVDPE